MPLGATLRELEREAERRIKSKAYRASPIGQQVGRWLRALRWADASPNTLDSYEGTLARLALEHDDFAGAAGFSPPVAPEYTRDFLDRHWGQSAPATRRQRLAAVKSFFTWAMAEGLCGWNPAAPIK